VAAATPDPQTAVPESPLSHDVRDARPRPLGSVLSPRQFWDLMQRWRVPDATALELIGYPGKIGAGGKRPRFRFTTRQQRVTSYLAEIDAAVSTADRDQAWLHRRIQGAPFSRRTPIEHIIAQGAVGAGDVLRTLNRQTMRAALAGSKANGHSSPGNRSGAARASRHRGRTH
jgi:hypothetical protein